jgi:hypothetical protein
MSDDKKMQKMEEEMQLRIAIVICKAMTAATKEKQEEFDKRQRARKEAKEESKKTSTK